MSHVGCPLRVAILCEFESVNGGERSLLAMLDALQVGVDPVVFAPPAGRLADELAKRRLTHQVFNVRDADGRRRPSTELLAELAMLINRHRPDLVHANSLAMARLTGELPSQPGLHRTAHLRDIVKLSNAAVRAINGNDRVIAVSQATADFHQAQGVDPTRLTVLHNGVVLDEFRPCRSRAERDGLRTRCGWRHEDFVVMSVGQIGMRKGLDVLIEAAGPLLRDDPRMRLWLVGERYSQKAEAVEFEQRLVRRQDEIGATAQVDWTGYRSDVSELMRGADLLVHAARQEPFGRVLLEAAATGMPIIATAAGGTRELLTAGESALIVPVGDVDSLRGAIARCRDDAALRERLGVAARRRVEQEFSIDSQAPKLLRLWQATVAGESS
ncbi:MAG: glycosyltransferase family 4 protein [Planctomycetaceae bacterium]